MAVIGDRMDSQSTWEINVMWNSTPKDEIFFSVVPVQVYWGKMDARDISYKVNNDYNVLEVTFNCPDGDSGDSFKESLTLSTPSSKPNLHMLECRVEISGNNSDLKLKFYLGTDYYFEFDKNDVEWDRGVTEFSGIVKVIGVKRTAPDVGDTLLYYD